MEKVLFVNRINELKNNDYKSYSRIYYGNEFCEKLIPSLYYPYVYITTSKKCLSSYLLVDNLNKCQLDCEGNSFSLKLGNSDSKIILKGNTQFYYNDKIEPHRNWNVNRLIFCPNL